MLYNQSCFTVFMHTYAYLELFKSVFSLNKQIFQLFQFIRTILGLLNHARRLKISKFKDFIKIFKWLEISYTRSPHSMWVIIHSVHKMLQMTKFSHITQWEDFVKITFQNYYGYKPKFLKLCKYQQNPVILMHNTNVIQSELLYCFYAHLCTFIFI